MIDDKHYQAYLIRFQRSEGQPHWRVTLQNAQTNKVVNFATERQLITFLLDTLRCTPVDLNNHGGDSANVRP